MSEEKTGKKAELLSNSESLVRIIDEGVKWSMGHMDDREGNRLRYDLKKNRRAVKKSMEALRGKPVLGLFGASQVGKSYMANNLLYNSDNLLLIHNHRNGQSVDFIKRINPEGKGNEATGAVTRFTSDVLADNSLKPVKVLLFSPSEVISILCDSFFSDYVDSSEGLDLEGVREYVAAIPNYASSPGQGHLTDDDVYEIQEYVERYFQKSLKEFLSVLNQLNYWTILADHIDRIDPSDWHRVFDLLWNRNPVISGILESVIDELRKTAFARVGYVDFCAVDRDGLDGNGKAIINVKTLENFFGQDDTHSLQLDDGSQVEMSASKLCFLAMEIVLTVSNESVEHRPFIRQTDIVDFPGARSREELRDLTENSRILMLLRGKVSFLFNSFSSKYRINTLFVCMRTQQTNVTTMPRLVNQWIDDNLGEDAEARSRSAGFDPPPLFIVFTWWNTQLQYKDKTDNMNPQERIEKLFETRFQQEIIGNYRWHREWVMREGSVLGFRNFYLLRDFKESELIYESDHGREIGFIGDPQREFFQRYRREFVEYHKTNTSFFPDPEMAFDEASGPNKDGTERIIRNLCQIPFEDNFHKGHLNRIRTSMEDVARLLRRHHHTDDADKLIRQSMQHASEIHMVMNMIFGKDTYHFAALVETMQVDEKAIYEMNHDILNNHVTIDRSKVSEMIPFKLASPRLRLGETPSEEVYRANLKVLMEDYNRDSPEDTESFFASKGIDLEELFFGDTRMPNKSDELAENALRYWFEKVLDADRFTTFIELGFDRSLLEKFLKNMKNSVRKSGLEKSMAQELKAYVDLDIRLDEASDMLAHIISAMINEYVTSMGWSYFSGEEKARIRQAAKANGLSLRFPDDTAQISQPVRLREDSEDSVSVESIIEGMERINEKLSKSRVDEGIVQNLPMIRSFNRWIDLMKISFVASCNIPNYDINVNRKLGETLRKFEEVRLP
jgi:hypothetical protein